jgi:hypothetical protein
MMNAVSIWKATAHSGLGEGTSPFVGKPGERHAEAEVRVEVLCPATLEHAALAAMRSAHPYEEVAYDLYPVLNGHPCIGSGLARGMGRSHWTEGHFWTS